MLRDTITDPLRRWFVTNGRGLVAAYLFGSVARGRERHDSDVDIAVVLGRRGGPEVADLDRLAEMQQQLSQLLQRPVDLVPLDGASPDLCHHVLADRVLLLDGDHDARIEFEVRQRNAYDDLEPFLREYRRRVLEKA